MKPSQEYLDMISKRLEAMNPGLVGSVNVGGECREPFKMPSFIDQVGMSAMEYLKNKKDPDIQPDPLFPNRN
jgi:hypothetical protein